MLSRKSRQLLRPLIDSYLRQGKTIDDLIHHFKLVYELRGWFKQTRRWKYLESSTNLNSENTETILQALCNPDMSCGDGPFHTGCDDPFLICCIVHDLEYIKKELGTQTKSKWQVDREFFDCMIPIATTWELKLRRYLYMAIVISPIGIVIWYT